MHQKYQELNRSSLKSIRNAPQKSSLKNLPPILNPKSLKNLPKKSPQNPPKNKNPSQQGNSRTLTFLDLTVTRFLVMLGVR